MSHVSWYIGATSSQEHSHLPTLRTLRVCWPGYAILWGSGKNHAVLGTAPPRVSSYAQDASTCADLVPDHNSYELYTHGQLAQCFRPGEDDQWLTWLAAQTAVAFHGRAGRLNLSQEARPHQ